MASICTVIPSISCRHDLLREALESVLRQTRRPDELIVVMDAPVLDREWAYRVGSTYPRAIVVPNGRTPGASGARNHAASLARSDILAFLDDDDMWMPGYLARVQVALDSGTRPNVLCTSFLQQLSDGHINEEKGAPEVLSPSAFLVRNPGFRCSNLVIAKEHFVHLGGFDETLICNHDVDMGLRLALCSNTLYCCISERLVVHRKHTGYRLSTPGTKWKELSLRRFFEKHSALMSESERGEFVSYARAFWKVDW